MLCFWTLSIVLSSSNNTALSRNFVLKINRTVFLDNDRTMDNVQKHNICTKIKFIRLFLSPNFVEIREVILKIKFTDGQTNTIS
jgi:hypothetical protein